MAIESKYGTVTTERGDIPEDEPVVVFRARDALLPDVLADYRRAALLSGCPPEFLESLSALQLRVDQWQATHPTHLPD